MSDYTNGCGWGFGHDTTGIESKLVDDFWRLGVDLTLPAEDDEHYDEFAEQESLPLEKYDYSDSSENHGDTPSDTDEEIDSGDESDSDDEGDEDEDDDDSDVE